MTTNAISRISETEVRAKLDDYGTDGKFTYNGDVIYGTLGTISKDEFAFRVWRQTTSVKWSDSRCRKEWNILNPDRKV
jgi:hypothetical protein